MLIFGGCIQIQIQSQIYSLFQSPSIQELARGGRSTSQCSIVVQCPLGLAPKVLFIYWSSKNHEFLVAKPKMVAKPKVAKPSGLCTLLGHYDCCRKS